MEAKVKIGIIGCGNIAPAYVRGCRLFNILELYAVADLQYERALGLAKEFDIPHALTVEELLTDPDIHIVINLTIPAVHAEVSQSILEANKHVYSEKPLAINRADGKKLVELAESRGLRIGCAPDTFLGGGIQTCRKLIDDGWIGEPVAATAFMMSPGVEAWHPNPFFYYAPGGGPMLDMGPYYLTALINLLGDVDQVTALSRISYAERFVTAKEHYGKTIHVTVPTHVTGLLQFNNGAIGTMITSFDIKGGANLPRIEIYGSEGSLSVPDPNRFDGPVKIKRAGSDEWAEIPLTHSDKVLRGIGVADMAYGIRYGRPHRASGKLAYHVLDIMHSFEVASETGQHIKIESSVTQPKPLPTGLVLGMLDA